MEFRYETICGLYCGACDVLLANQEGTLESLAQAWGMDPELLRCQGCKSQTNAVYCIDCEIKACAEDRGVSFCFHCPDYPCPRLVDFRNDDHAHHAIVLQNLSEISNLGLDEWLVRQQARWRCPSCATAFSWYDEHCKSCGGELYNCQDEQSQIIDGFSDR